MNLSQLYYFRKLTEVQYYTKAAQEPYIIQFSLSASILSLERDLDTDLFQWEGGGMELTGYGRDFYVHACKALVELEVGIDNVKEDSGIIGGMIDVACIPTLCGDFLPRSISSYIQECNPTVKSNVFNGMTPAIVEGVRSDAYDVRFCSMSEGETDLCFTPILSQEYTATVNSTRPLVASEGKPTKLENLKPYEILTYPENNPVGRTIKRELEKRNLKVAHYGHDKATTGEYAVINQAVAIAADTPLLKQFNNPVHLDVKLEAEARLAYMMYHKNNYLTPAARNYTQHVLDRSPGLGGISILA